MIQEKDIEVPFIIRRTSSKEEQSDIIPSNILLHSKNVSLQSIPQSEFVCFSCKKTTQNESLHNQNQVCPQCGGSGFVQRNHPFVKLINQIFNKKFGFQEINKTKKIQKSQKKSRYSSSSNQQMVNNNLHMPSYRSFKSDLMEFNGIIKEQSSFFQDKSMNCYNCNQDCDQLKYSCSQCENFSLCQTCYLQKKIFHQHPLKKIYTSKNPSKTCSNNELQKQECFSNQIRCSRGKCCHKCTFKIDDCYWHCQTCKKQNKNFIVCKQCYDQEGFHHQKSHQLLLNFHTLNSSAYKDEDQQSMTQPFAIIDEQQFECSPTNLETNQIPFKIQNQSSQNADLFQQILQQHCKNGNQISKAKLQNFFSIDSEYQQNRQVSLKLQNQPKKKNFNQSQILMDLSCDSIGQLQRSTSQQVDKKPTQNINSNFFLQNVRSIQYQNYQPLNPQYQKKFFFIGYECDICGVSPIPNKKYHCINCEDYDICQNCYLNRRKEHYHDHYELQDGNQVAQKQKQAKRALISNRISSMSQRKSLVNQENVRIRKK